MKSCTLVTIMSLCVIVLVKGQTTPKPTPGTSCVGNCRGCNSFGCCCDNACLDLGDCCDDFLEVCPPGCGDNTPTIPNGGSIDVFTPNYPSNYPSNSDCEWILRTQDGTRVFVEHVDFNTEENFDVYSAGNGDTPSLATSVIWQHSGANPPPDFLSDGGTAWITFTSDLIIQRRGFHVVAHDSGHGTCSGFCGLYNDQHNCSCTDTCVIDDDCCSDYFDICGGDCNEDIQIPTNGNVIITTPNYPSNYPDYSRCQWIVDTAQGTRINVTFNDFNTQEGADYLFAGHGSDPSQATSEIWAHSGSQLPPNYVSDHEKVWLQFTSDGSITDTGFQATLWDRGTSSCNGECETYSSDGCSCFSKCAYDFNCCDDFYATCSNGCNFDYSVPVEGSVVATSPNYPSDYPPDANCQWIFTANVGGRLNVSFDDFLTEACCDQVWAGEGDTPSADTTIIAGHGGSELPPSFLTTGSSAWMRFYSDSSVQMRGFQATVSYVYGSCDGNCDSLVAGCSCYSDCLYDFDCCPDYHEVCAFCDVKISVPVGGSVDVTSLEYPDDYLNDNQCQWILTAEDDARLFVQYIDFATETCCDFYFSGNTDQPSSDNAVIVAHSGDSLPPNFMSTDPSVWMRSASDWSITDRGFHARVYHTTAFCGGQCEFMAEGCSCYSDCIYNDNCCIDYFESCAADCTFSYFLSAGESIDIMSPNYPSNYNNNDQCKWVVNTADRTELRVEYIDFDTEAGSDFYSAGHGTMPSQATSEVWTHSGSVAPNDFYSATDLNGVWMTFTSDSINTTRGFHAVVTHTGGSCANDCGIILPDCRCRTDCVYTDSCCRNYFDLCAVDCSETAVIPTAGKVDVMSPNYPQDYPDNALCQWLTTNEDGNDIMVQFVDFDTEEGYDYFFSGNGNDPSQNSSVIWAHSGSVLPSNYRSSGDTVWIRFVSDNSVSRSGFHVSLSDAGSSSALEENDDSVV
ncbi:CUB and sushi domain-containing protein 1-like [Saccoglossus kowalevskii]